MRYAFCFVVHYSASIHNLVLIFTTSRLPTIHTYNQAIFWITTYVSTIAKISNESKSFLLSMVYSFEFPFSMRVVDFEEPLDSIK